MSEHKEPIPSMIYNAAVGGHVTNSQQIIDENENKEQSQINAEVKQILGKGGSVDSRISAVVAKETERAKEEEANRYTKSETYSKEEVHNLITTPNQEYVSVIATSQITSITDVLPVTGVTDTIYRIGNWDGTQYNDSVFSEYAWNSSAYIKLSTKSQIGEIYDISVNHADTKYIDLVAALGTNGENIPQSLRKGGMLVKYIQSSNNKYVQCRLIAQSFTTDVTQWQSVDDNPVPGSNNLINSNGVQLLQSELYMGLYSFTELTVSGKIHNVSIYSNGEIKDSLYYNLFYYAVSPGVYKVNLKGTEGFKSNIAFFKNVPEIGSIGTFLSSYTFEGKSSLTQIEACIKVDEQGYIAACFYSINGPRIWVGDKMLKGVDDTPTNNSNKLVKSGGIKSYIDNEISQINEDIDEIKNDIYTKELCNKTLTASVGSNLYQNVLLIPRVANAQRIRITITGIDITQVSCQTIDFKNNTVIKGDFSNGVVADIPAMMYYWYIRYNSPQEDTKYNVLIECLALKEIVGIHDNEISQIKGVVKVFDNYRQAEVENKKFISLHSGIDARSISNGTSKYDEIRVTSSDADMSIEACSLIYNLRKIADEGKHVFSMDGYYINSATSNYIDNEDGTYSPVPVEDIDETNTHQIAGTRTNITDSHCAMSHYELGSLLNSWVANGSSTDANATKKAIATFISVIRYMWEVHGCVPSFSWHLCNPYIPCNPPSEVSTSNGVNYVWGVEGYPSDHRYVINEILNNTGETCGYGRVTGVDGQSYTNPREWFEAMCELLGNFIKDLKDSHGNNIPVILRLWHEFDDTWSWWGANMVTTEDYISFYQLTVNLIKQYSNTHNILFGFCPDRLNLGTVYKTHYPGDEYVDVVGFDDYSIGRTNEDIRKRVEFVCNFADTHNKISAIFETGNEWEGDHELNVFNDFLYPAVSNGDRLSIIQMWSTVYVRGNHFGDGAENDTIRAADFRKFVNRHDMLTFDLKTGTNPINWIKITENK